MTDTVKNNDGANCKSPVDFQAIIQRQRVVKPKANAEVYGPTAADRDGLVSICRAPISEIRILEKGKEHELGRQIFKDCQNDVRVIQSLHSAASAQSYKNAQNFDIFHPILESIFGSEIFEDFKLLSKQVAGDKEWNVYESSKGGARQILIAPSHVANAANTERTVPDPILLLGLDNHGIPLQLLKFDRGKLLISNLYPDYALKLKFTVLTNNYEVTAPQSQKQVSWLYPRHAQSLYQQLLSSSSQYGGGQAKAKLEKQAFNKFIAPGIDDSQPYQNTTFQTLDGFKLKSGLEFKDEQTRDYVTRQLEGKDFKVFIADENENSMARLMGSTESMIADHLDMPVLTIRKIDDEGYITEAEVREPFEAFDCVSDLLLSQLGNR